MAIIRIKSDAANIGTGTMAEFKPPKYLVIGLEENPANKWRDWIELIELHMAIQTHTYTEKQKVPLLLYSMGPEYMTVFKNFNFDVPSDVENVNVVKAKFEAYFEPKKLFLTAFQSRVQNDNEAITLYISAFNELGRQCEFEGLKDRQIALQISNGVRDIQLKEQLWENDLSLDSVIKKCHLYEQLLDTRKMVSSTVTEERFVHQISKQ